MFRYHRSIQIIFGGSLFASIFVLVAVLESIGTEIRQHLRVVLIFGGWNGDCEFSVLFEKACCPCRGRSCGVENNVHQRCCFPTGNLSKARL